MMCGFLGLISNDEINIDKLEESNKFNICRGPDSKAIINNKTNQLSSTLNNLNYSFIFNRLSIIDLSQNAMQPMASEEYGTMILFNGEIYNHRDLRKKLENKNIMFRTSHSDTELLLLGISEFGLSFLDEIVGQFAIAFVNFKSKKLILIRDRIGQKPLFYSLGESKILFSSNLKSILKYEDKKRIDIRAINNYLNFGVVPSPQTLYENIFKLEPGSYLEIDLSNDNIVPKLEKYWDPKKFINDNKFDKEIYFELFHNAVSDRLESDVPVANFLSGGIDSTSIIKSLHDQGYKQINTFSVRNKEEKYDESKWINNVVQNYETNHISTELNGDFATRDILESINIFDEPYADPSTVPSYLLNKLIAENYKVAISGDGGDELMGGYRRMSKVLNRKRYGISEKIYNFYPSYLGTGNKILSQSKNLSSAYGSFLEDQKLMKLLKLNDFDKFDDRFFHDTKNDRKSILLSDYLFFLPEMMMLKVDRTSMANSVEVRSPFVDHRLIEYVLDSSYSNFNFVNSKKIMKDYLSSDFGEEFINRPKQGFVFNLEGWVFKNLSLINEVIDEGEIIKNLNKKVISKLAINKSRINGHRIWKLFFLEYYLLNID